MVIENYCYSLLFIGLLLRFNWESLTLSIRQRIEQCQIQLIFIRKLSENNKICGSLTLSITKSNRLSFAKMLQVIYGSYQVAT